MHYCAQSPQVILQTLLLVLCVSGSLAISCTLSSSIISTAITFSGAFKACTSISYNSVTFQSSVMVDVAELARLSTATVKLTFQSCTFQASPQFLVQGADSNAAIAGMVPFSLSFISTTISSTPLFSGTFPKQSAIVFSSTTVTGTTISLQATFFSSQFAMFSSSVASALPFQVQKSHFYSSTFSVQACSIRAVSSCTFLESVQTTNFGTSFTSFRGNSYTTSLTSLGVVVTDCGFTNGWTAANGSQRCTGTRMGAHRAQSSV